MNIKKYSRQKIYHPEELEFNPDDFSRFKYGDDLVARQFGTELAEGFIESHLQNTTIAATQMVVLSSPYSFIPTATFAMKNHFVSVLNRWLVDHDFPVVQEAKVHRTITYKDDYGALDAAQRMALIGNDIFQIDKYFLEEKVLLFLDDIRITGSHERVILKMANEYQMENDVFMLYYAELLNKEVHPRFENHLNYHCVKSIFDLHEIINSGHFKINTRITKYLLNYETTDFIRFMQQQKEAFLNELYDMAVGNGYHTIEAYQENLNLIKDEISLTC